MSTAVDHIRSLEEMFEKAKSKGLWFVSNYQNIWLSPNELRKEQAKGLYQWGASNWTLRNPAERVAELKKKVYDAQKELNDFEARLNNK